MKLYDVVELATDLPDEGLPAGSLGTVVQVFHQPDLAYEVEFADDEGEALAMVALTADQLRPYF